jgi:polyferredoxin
VVACPTGIDIREGLQLECISCGQCVDACNNVMPKVHKPNGLIRYTSQAELATGQPSSLVRGRTLIYGLIFSGLLASLVLVGRKGPLADVTVLRGTGAPYVEEPGGVRNQIRVKIVNRTDEARSYHLTVLGLDDGRVVVPQNPFHVPAHGQATTAVFAIAPGTSFVGSGERRIMLRVNDGAGFSEQFGYKLLGPARGRQGGS